MRLTTVQHRVHSVNPRVTSKGEHFSGRYDARRRLQARQGRGRPVHRRPVLRSTRRHATLHDPYLVLRRERVRGRAGVRRLVDSRLPVDPRVRHDAAARPGHRAHRSVPRRQDAEPELLRARPVHPRGVLARSAQRRPQGRELPRQHRHRRHRLLRRRGRVLHLRLGGLRLAANGTVLRSRRRSRAGGTPATRPRPTAARTVATRSVTRAVTSRWPPTTSTSTCATRC